MHQSVALTGMAKGRPDAQACPALTSGLIPCKDFLSSLVSVTPSAHYGMRGLTHMPFKDPLTSVSCNFNKYTCITTAAKQQACEQEWLAQAVL